MAGPAQPAGGSSLAKLPPVAKFGLGLFFVLAIGAGYWLFFYSDVSKKITAAQKQQRDLNDERTKQRQARETYMRDKEELAVAQQRSRELNKVLPADTQEAGFLQSLQQATNAAGLKLEAWFPQEEKIQSFYAKVPMRLEVTGKFHQMMKFSSEVGKIDRIINLENIELVEVKQTGDDVTMKGRCLATAFHTLKPREPAPPGGAPK
jgi:type IV pilus assembly protein PilO